MPLSFLFPLPGNFYSNIISSHSSRFWSPHHLGEIFQTPLLKLAPLPVPPHPLPCLAFIWGTYHPLHTQQCLTEEAGREYVLMTKHGSTVLLTQKDIPHVFVKEKSSCQRAEGIRLHLLKSSACVSTPCSPRGPRGGTSTTPERSQSFVLGAGLKVCSCLP